MKKVIEDAKKVILAVGGDAYLVGGYVRDKLISIKNTPENLDIILDCDMEEAIREFELKNYKFSLVNKDNETYVSNFNGKTLKLSKLKSETIEQDLASRDFTMNAIAIKLIDNKVIDPFQGRTHIKRRIIQRVSEESIKNDPVRILRGIRFYIKYGMHFSAYTEVDIRNEAKNILSCPKESVLDELMNIIHNDENGVFFETADQFYVLKHLLPYMDELKTVGKCKYHMVDAFTHMNTAYHVFKDIQRGYIRLKNINIDDLDKNIGKYSCLDYFAFSIFVHDIGKFESYKVDGDKISFKDHEKTGTNIIVNFCEKLNFPKDACNIIYAVVKNHMYPLSIFKEEKKEYNKEFCDFFNKFKEYSLYIIIASFCDVYATKMYIDVDDEKIKYKQFIENMIIEYEKFINKK